MKTLFNLSNNLPNHLQLYISHKLHDEQSIWFLKPEIFDIKQKF
jgi:hypothetical protein